MFLDSASINVEEVITRQREEGYVLIGVEISNDLHSIRSRRNVLELRFSFGSEKESSLVLFIARANFGYEGTGPIDTARFIYCAVSQRKGTLSHEDIRQLVFAARTDSTVRQIDFR